MRTEFDKADKLSKLVIGAAIEVHREKGPGLVESIYEWCLGIELDLRNISYSRQKKVEISYKGRVRDEPLRYDLLVEDCLLLELKCVGKIVPVHKAQLLSYMKILDVPLGLLINFNEGKLIDGLSRVTLKGADK